MGILLFLVIYDNALGAIWLHACTIVLATCPNTVFRMVHLSPTATIRTVWGGSTAVIETTSKLTAISTATLA